MNASALIDSVQFSIPYTKSKATVQPANVAVCSTYKEQLGPVNNDYTLTLFPTATSTPTEICTNQTYKETIGASLQTNQNQNQTCPIAVVSSTIAPTEVCSQINYKVQLKRVNCNTMA